MEHPKVKRYKPKFIHFLFVGAFIGAGILWYLWLSYRAADQKKAVQTIQNRSGKVVYGFQVGEGNRVLDTTEVPSIPGFLVSFFGRDFFSNVQWVEMEINDKKDVEIFSKLPRLKRVKLIIRDQKVNDFNISHLTELESFSLTNGRLENLNQLEKLKSVQEIRIVKSSIISLSPIKDLPNLRDLSLIHCKVQDDYELGLLNHLTSLDLTGYQHKSDLNEFSGFTNLRHLTCNVLPEKNLKDIAALQKLQSLVVNGPIVSLQGIESLSHLNLLSVHSKRLEDVSDLRKLNPLKQLDLSSANSLKLDAIADLNDLEVIRLSTKKIATMSFLKNKPSLWHVDLSDIEIGDSSALSDLNSVTSLRLSNVKPKNFSFLESMSQLEFLDVSYCKILKFANLKNLKSIRWLELKESSITKTESQKLQSLYPEAKIGRYDQSMHWITPFVREKFE